MDVVSGGELQRALRAGYRGADIIFGGVGKTEEELREALAAGVAMINVESEAEVRAIGRIAGELGMPARVSLRVNPEVTVDAAHHYIKTGERGHKFGIPYDDALHVARITAGLPAGDAWPGSTCTSAPCSRTWNRTAAAGGGWPSCAARSARRASRRCSISTSGAG